MAGNDKAAKAAPAPKKEAAVQAPPKAAPDAALAKEAAPAKAEGDAPAASSSYSRGEGQKPVTQAYKDNWNAIFGKKKKKR